MGECICFVLSVRRAEEILDSRTAVTESRSEMGRAGRISCLWKRT